MNPALEEYQAKTPITVAASDCNFHIFIGPWSRQTACDRAKDFLGKAGLSFKSVPSVGDADVVTTVGSVELRGWDQAKYQAALKETGYPAKADPARVNWVAVMTLVVGTLFVRETKDRTIHDS